MPIPTVMLLAGETNSYPEGQDKPGSDIVSYEQDNESHRESAISVGIATCQCSDLPWLEGNRLLIRNTDGNPEGRYEGRI